MINKFDSVKLPAMVNKGNRCMNELPENMTELLALSILPAQFNPAFTQFIPFHANPPAERSILKQH
ncbi:MAG TPA: hypothetical protein VIZ28_07620 [Chitinophagaceae bacterium]